MASSTNRLDGSPSPVSPLWHCADAVLTLVCACGRTERHRPRELFAGQDPHAKLYELVARLRCRACGTRPRATDVR
ncbi:hypothetical protein ACVFYP_22145 [Roseomonas sp. F4]